MAETLAVYVPKDGALTYIRRGSGIVGKPVGVMVRIDFEGNLYGAINLQTWRQRVLTAADRCMVNYPTVARAYVEPDKLIKVGETDGHGVLVHFNGEAHVAEWVGTPIE